VDRPTLKKPKIGNFAQPPQGAKIFLQDFEYTYNFFQEHVWCENEGNRRRLLFCVGWERAAFSRYVFLNPHQFEGSDNDTGKNDTKFTPKGTLCAVDYIPHFLVQNLIQKSLVKCFALIVTT
jgi:hypothetical protein